MPKRPRTPAQVKAEKANESKWAEKVLVRLDDVDQALLAKLVDRFDVSKPEIVRLAIRHLSKSRSNK